MGLVSCHDFCDKTMQTVTRKPIKKKKFPFPRVSSGSQLLNKKPEGPCYKIGFEAVYLSAVFSLNHLHLTTVKPRDE